MGEAAFVKDTDELWTKKDIGKNVLISCGLAAGTFAVYKWWTNDDTNARKNGDVTNKHVMESDGDLDLTDQREYGRGGSRGSRSKTAIPYEVNSDRMDLGPHDHAKFSHLNSKSSEIIALPKDLEKRSPRSQQREGRLSLNATNQSHSSDSSGRSNTKSKVRR